MSQKSLSISKTNWNFEKRFTYLVYSIIKSNVAVQIHVSISCLALALSFTPLLNYVFFPTVYFSFLFLFLTHSIKMNTTERVFIVTLKIKECKNEEIRNQFEKKFHKRGPTDKAIRELLMKFQRTGSVHDDSRNGRPKMWRRDLVRNAFEQDSRMSICRAQNLLEISRLSLQRFLRTDLKKKAYHIQVCHGLTEEDYPARAAMCAELIDQIQDANLLDNILFSDEATFHTCGKVNRRNCRTWGNEKSTKFPEWQGDSTKVNVWLGMTNRRCMVLFPLQKLQLQGQCIWTCLRILSNRCYFQMAFLTQQFFRRMEHRVIMHWSYVNIQTEHSLIAGLVVVDHDYGQHARQT